MSGRPGFPEALASLSSALGRVGARWYLFGAQAVALYGVPRLTADVDVTVEVPNDDTSDLVASLERDGIHPRADIPVDFVQRTRVLPLVHEPTGIPIDLVLAGPGLEESFLDRAGPVHIAGFAVPVMSPEDLVATKLLAGRPRDGEDVRGILAQQKGRLDLDRVRQVLELLEEALDRRDLVSELEAALREVGSSDPLD